MTVCSQPEPSWTTWTLPLPAWKEALGHVSRDGDEADFANYQERDFVPCLERGKKGNSGIFKQF